MTAPDPGLTDLIAAHQAGDRRPKHTFTTVGTLTIVTGAVTWVTCTCGEPMELAQHPAHVALVVEQHTNGRIAELEARVDEWSADLWEVVRARDEWRARAEQAEATVARVRGEVSAYSEIIPAVALADLRAALEGEQQ